MKLKRIGLLIVVASFFTGCASIMSGPKQSVMIDSEPKGATVTIGEEMTRDHKKIMAVSNIAGVTPITVTIPRKDGMIEISKEGYRTQQVELVRSMNAWFLGDVVLTSLLSSSIDTSTGALYEYKPGQYMITLVPVNAPVDAPVKAPVNAPVDAPSNAPVHEPF
jgi:hypothetical protein